MEYANAIERVLGLKSSPIVSDLCFLMISYPQTKVFISVG